MLTPTQRSDNEHQGMGRMLHGIRVGYLLLTKNRTHRMANDGDTK